MRKSSELVIVKNCSRIKNLGKKKALMTMTAVTESHVTTSSLVSSLPISDHFFQPLYPQPTPPSVTASALQHRLILCPLPPRCPSTMGTLPVWRPSLCTRCTRRLRPISAARATPLGRACGTSYWPCPLEPCWLTSAVATGST